MIANYHQPFVPWFRLTAVLLLSVSMPAMGAPGDTELISTGAGNFRGMLGPAISRDGRYVALATDDGIQLRDRLTEVTQRVDRGMDGQTPNSYAQDPDLSPDGRFVTPQHRCACTSRSAGV
jgi:hypothetical protein